MIALRFDSVWGQCYSPNHGNKNFKRMSFEVDYNSDIASPPLWKNSGSSINPHDLSCAIAQYQQEMLDMVRGLPEPDYELSMRDLIELSSSIHESSSKEETTENKDGGHKDQERPTGATKKILRTESMDSGVFLLKMPLQFPGGRRRNSRGESSNSNRERGGLSKDNHNKRRRKLFLLQWKKAIKENGRDNLERNDIWIWTQKNETSELDEL